MGTANCIALPLICRLSVWLNTSADGMLITNSCRPAALRRMVPVHGADAGRDAEHPEPLVTLPAQFPNTGSLAAWLTVTVWPATVTVPVRASPRFSVTVMATVPGPLLLVTDVTLKNEEVEETVQAQPAFVVTLIVADPPTLAMFNVVDPNTYEHVAVGGGVGEEGVLVAQATLTNKTRALNTEPDRTKRASGIETSGSTVARQAHAGLRLVTESPREMFTVADKPSWNWRRLVLTKKHDVEMLRRLACGRIAGRV